MEKNIKQYSEDEILKQYNILVKKIALKIISKLPANIYLDDLMQAGLMALLEAAKNYDDTKGASFETYAGIRIKGAIIDEIRREDWLPRSSHKNSKLLDKIKEYTANNQDKKFDINEICKYLNISKEEYNKLLNSTKSNLKVYNFDDIGVSEDSILNNYQEKDIFSTIEHTKLKQAIASNINKLPIKERMVLTLYYENELSLKQIGEILSVTESRACQIHSKAMSHLEKYLSGWQ